MLSPGSSSSVSVHDGDAEQRPALLGCFDVARDFGLGHSGIVLERHGRERRPRLIATADAGEGHDGPDVRAPARELCRLGRGVEWFALKTDGGGHRWDSNWDPQAKATSVPVPTFAAMSIATSDPPH